ncbi:MULTISPECIES: type I phosphomannose isomerase catalytic subunit [Flavobacteriaceae]|uniref:Phosphohexomutase n=1 Tax=Gaetbulibacter jejuensis TaxID=584607 RepID=A0ABN1JJN7_9FLAO|nr:type I phosphomannose isomerase catalytic subunit [Meridianimaribacter sp. CL38]RYH75455.1 mannose-6-phosphate isomerase [Flavobacteriaceae bacterium 144Ye]TBV27565.1 mannose-6-phosphate isomerase [Meridianimaribacter sp. CL38]
MKNILYPIKFTPILKDKIWGGQKLKTLLNKTSDLPNIGESWEISDVEGDTSVVANGALKGQTLKQIQETYKEDLIGLQNYRVFGNKFPLLIKFIDAKQDLSIQLHPNDELAAKRHNSFGKTEMWYVMQADEGSNLIVGFNQKMDAETYLSHLENKTLTEILNFDKVKVGDTYFIEVGRVHAIGAGVVVAEIQQTSDITYRVYDWDRVDDEGNERELHNDLAIDAIDFEMEDNFRVSYEKAKNQSNKMVSCPYFTTSYLDVDSTLKKENNHDSFLIYMCVEGEAQITTDSGTETIKKGETILLPAAVKNYEITSENAKLLEVYV